MACKETSQERTRLDRLEVARLRAVHATGLSDTEPESDFTELTKLAAAICATPVGALSLLDERRQWFKAIVGLDLQQTPREHSFCDYTIRQGGPFIVEDARLDARFANNPYVTCETGVAFYAGMPLKTADGHALGALCVLDHQPRTLTAQQQEGLRILARQVMAWIELRNQQNITVAAIAEKDRMAAWLADYQQQLESANDRLRALAATDELTGLHNRRAFRREARV
jgi:GAF domain-containing protein